MNNIAHIKDGVVTNVSLGDDSWLAWIKTLDTTTVYTFCPDYVYIGYRYDSESQEFSPPPEDVDV